MKRFFVFLAAMALLILFPRVPVYAQVFPYGHDNSTIHHNWTHGDPNIGTPPKSYYYIKAIAAGSNVFCELYSAFPRANLRLEDSSKRVLAEADFAGQGGRVFITNATPGHMYQCRLENDSAMPMKDYLELNSGAAGDILTSDCGGPGPVVDPNFDAPPMEPLHTQGMPVNGCNGVSGSIPYDPTDPRVGIPLNQQSYDLGVNRGNATYTIVTTRYADLTAFVFFGSQGDWGTMTITDDSGNVVNGPKWGAMEANPGHANQEYVGADAGQVPPGTYHIRFRGPANSQHVWAMSGNV